MGNLKREYLKAEEKNFYMIAKAFIQSINGERNLEGTITDEIWDEWGKRGMCTTSMKKNLKLVKTYLKKFCYEIEENLSKIEMERLNKQLNKFDYRLVDDYTFQKLMRDMTNNMQYAVIDRCRLAPILEDIAAVRCVGCTCNYEKCDLYKMLDDISVAFVKEEPNCPYACNLSEYTEEELKNIERLKKTINKRKSVIKEFGRVVEHEDSGTDSKCSTGKSKIKTKSSNGSQTQRNNKKNRRLVNI